MKFLSGILPGLIICCLLDTQFVLLGHQLEEGNERPPTNGGQIKHLWQFKYLLNLFPWLKQNTELSPCGSVEVEKTKKK